MALLDWQLEILVEHLQEMVTRNTDFGAICMKLKEQMMIAKEREQKIEFLLPVMEAEYSEY